MSKRLGKGDINLPFEPSTGTLDPADAEISGGVVVLACAVPLENGDTKPGLMFRFLRPDGTFYRPMLLVIEPSEAAALVDLVEDGVSAAVKAASS